jgi:hypothetical protein
MAKGGKLAALMERVKSLGLDLEKFKTQLEIRGKGIAEDEDKLKSVRDSITEVSRVVVAYLSSCLCMLTRTYRRLSSPLLD